MLLHSEHSCLHLGSETCTDGFSCSCMYTNAYTCSPPARTIDHSVQDIPQTHAHVLALQPDHTTQHTHSNKYTYSIPGTHYDTYTFELVFPSEFFLNLGGVRLHVIACVGGNVLGKISTGLMPQITVFCMSRKLSELAGMGVIYNAHL